MNETSLRKAPSSNADLPDAGDRDPKEQALADVRDMLRTANVLPAAGLSGPQQHEQVRTVAETLQALEKSLTNEVSQQAGDVDEQ